MLQKPLLFIANYISSTSAKFIDAIETEHTESMFDIQFTESVENTESIASKEFCVYTSNSMIKMVDPYYTDASNNIIF